MGRFCCICIVGHGPDGIVQAYFIAEVEKDVGDIDCQSYYPAILKWVLLFLDFLLMEAGELCGTVLLPYPSHFRADKEGHPVRMYIHKLIAVKDGDVEVVIFSLSVRCPTEVLNWPR